MNQTISQLTSDCQAWLSDADKLQQSLAGFRPRQSQMQMAEAVSHAIDTDSTLVVEAGTGTGKTFAYLIPVFISHAKTIISTDTKNLQDQLFHRDIPTLKKAMQVNVRVALLKGRNNYVCHHRVLNALQSGRFYSREQAAQAQRIYEWSKQTIDGDLAGVKDLPDDPMLINAVTSTADNCLHRECEFVEQCFVAKARDKAMQADVVVVNHYLLCADMSLKEDGFGSLLPPADVVIVDEAHQLPEVAGKFLSLSLSSRQLNELANDIQDSIETLASELNQTMMSYLMQLDDASHALKRLLGDKENRALWKVKAKNTEVFEQLNILQTCLTALGETLEQQLKDDKDAELLIERCAKGIELLHTFQHHEDGAQESVHWFEVFKKSFILHQTPIDISEGIEAYQKKLGATWIYTSATLSVGQSFANFTDVLGLQSAQCLQLDSPFDYTNQALLYVPRGMPDPNQPHYTDELIKAVKPVLTASGGRAFLLFTSYFALNRAVEALSQDCDFPILVQGQEPKAQLLKKFRQIGNAVLLATQSFWQGVDVAGEALSLVVIDRLPFQPPDDPVMQAKMDRYRRQGKNPFAELQLPNAVTSLKQGAGRLIRDVDDKGVLLIADPRLVGNQYGATFLQSLPNMPRTRSLVKVQQFFQELDSTCDENVSVQV